MLKVELAGIKFRNPVILASGVMGTTGEALKRAARNGAGGVVSKSAGAVPREGHKNPTVVEVPQGVINSIGLANPGAKEMAEELRVAREGGVPVIASVYGFSVEDYIEASKVLENVADAVELNLSCPSVKEAGSLFGTSAEMSERAVLGVREEVEVPVFAKLTAEAGDVVAVAKACERAGASALTAINTLKAVAIDIKAAEPLLGNKLGGLSGACIKPIAVRCVYEISREVDIPVVGCGGVSTGRDAIEYIMAGARAVQIGYGVLKRGTTVFRKVVHEMEEFLEERGVSLEEIRGVALK